jgi:hypothetical protein
LAGDASTRLFSGSIQPFAAAGLPPKRNLTGNMRPQMADADGLHGRYVAPA